MVTRFVLGLIRGRLRVTVVPVFGPSDVGGKWVWSYSGPWSCAVRRVQRLYWYYICLLSFVIKAMGTDPGVSGGALV